MTNMALAAWIKFSGTPEPAIAMTAFLGAALLYLLGSHLVWLKHVVAADSASAGLVCAP